MDFLLNSFEFKNDINVYGLTKELNCFYILELFNKKNDNLLVVTNSLYEANNFYNSLKVYTDSVLFFPMDDFLTSVVIAESPELKLTRLECLKKLKNSKNIVITNLMGYLKFLPNKNKEYEINISLNKEFKRDILIKKLDSFGYKKESIVTSTGEYAVRGFVIDVFAVDESHPFRIEFDDDLIEDIRYFDEENQLSLNKIKSIIIPPLKEIIDNEYNSILDYVNYNVVYIDYDQIKVAYQKLEEDILKFKKEKEINDKLMFGFNDLNPKFEINLNTFSTSLKKNSIKYDSKEIINYHSDFDLLKNDVLKYKKEGKTVIFCLSRDSQIKIIKNLNLDVKIIKKKINKGFIFQDYVVISENDLEQNMVKNLNYKNNYKFGKRVKDYNQLEIGDYVVHLLHGIGIYNGLVTLQKNGVSKDYLQILYDGDDKIYVPVEKINTIYKYNEKDGLKPKLNKLNSTSWSKTKAYITGKIKDISKDLIKLYKERLSINTTAYKKYPERDLFASSFQYELTLDQEKSINDIYNDLESNYPMDRVLCGDVGFGKTEVAFRAMFETVLNNKIVLYLCPTTILSKQQYEVALERFKDWPINIAILNRFVSNKKAKEILEDLEKGRIDILFGTHRILSDDVNVKDLGLLVVDEEQRFGVAHKEKIKKLKKDVNVLTLSATPIPRTMKMALSGVRDLSIIDTPPVNRFPVQTYVILEEDLIVRDAIYKELSRNGQVFILYNNVEELSNIKFRINQLVPDARIACAHGKMSKNELEGIMNDFVDYKYDILLCTTIIESGIDIANANTLIVYNADQFGLSQLYQIRGRVGRSDRIAYCYLLYKPNKVLNEAAVKRLESIKEFTELGSGYRIAMRDLSIRGAGDIFGSNQAGFIDSLGISLYLKMIDDEVRRQKGETVEEENYDNNSLINIDTHISDDYVSDEDVKIEIHQRINEIDSLEKYNEVKNELIDRFGKIDEQLENYMYEEWFESLADKYNITRVKQTDRLIEIEFPEELSNKISGDKLLINAFQISKNFNIKYERKKIIITLYYKNLEHHFVTYLVKLLLHLDYLEV